MTTSTSTSTSTSTRSRQLADDTTSYLTALGLKNITCDERWERDDVYIVGTKDWYFMVGYADDGLNHCLCRWDKDGNQLENVLRPTIQEFTQEVDQLLKDQG